jgi:hypothetical protein
MPPTVPTVLLATPPTVPTVLSTVESKLRHELRIVVERLQRALDDRADIVEPDDQGRLRLHALDADLDLSMLALAPAVSFRRLASRASSAMSTWRLFTSRLISSIDRLGMSSSTQWTNRATTSR